MRSCNGMIRPRAGFTLIEILVVIAIIGLMAAASLVALGGARGFFKNVTAKMFLDDLAQSIELYNQKFGEYPPDSCASDAEIQRHILKRWPKVLKTGKVGNMVAFAREEMQRTPGSALLFWLAGPPDDTPTGIVYDGFLSDANNPFGLDPDGNRMPYDDIKDEPCEAPLLELQYHSEEESDGNYDDCGLCYQGQTVAYFRGADSKNGYEGKSFLSREHGIVAPYMNNGRWYNPNSYQLIMPGQDGSYGAKDPNMADGYVPRDLGTPVDRSEDLSGSGVMTANDLDNITNFTDGATLDSELE